MGAAQNPTRSNIPDERRYNIRIQGTGAADPTLEIGAGVTVKWVSTGLYRFTWPQGPGTFIGLTHNLAAATTSDLKGFTVVRDTYDTTNHQLDVAIYNASNNLADLAATQYVDLIAVFAEDSQAR